MDKKQYIIYNGDFINKEDPVLKATNRAFTYGDGIFETIFASGTLPLLAGTHYHRCMKGLTSLKIDIPKQFTLDFFIKEIQRILNKNRIYKGARVKFMFFRSAGGYYSPINNAFEYLIDTETLENEQYSLNKKGISIDIYTELNKPVNPLSSLKSMNSLLYVMAGINKIHSGSDELLILNQNQHLCESISSNVFLVEDNLLITPPLADGCVEGVMRTELIRIAEKNKIKVIDNLSIHPKRIEEADELFLSNAIKGIQWVLAYKQKRYFNTMAKTLHSLLLKEHFTK